MTAHDTEMSPGASNVAIGVPVTNVDFGNPDLVLDPFPVMHSIREMGPVVYHEKLGQYLVTGYDDCARILANAADFASDTEFFTRLFGGETMECMEHDRHSKVRGIWAKDFRRPTLQEQRRMISAVVEDEVPGFARRVRDGETVDAMREMIHAIPTRVIATMMGIPNVDYAQFSRWSDEMTCLNEGVADPSQHGQDLLRRGKEATASLNDYIEHRVAECRDAPGDDLVSRMVCAPAAEQMTHQEIVASNTQLVFAGNESTSKLLGQIVLALAQHPDQQEMLRHDRSLVPAAIEEIHRWNSVVHAGWRFVRGTQRVADTALPDGSTVLCLQGVANRDPNRWDEPDRLDITRAAKPHLGFGWGMHMCLGVHLARIEAEIWLDRLLDELPSWDVAYVDWGRDWMLRGPVRLDVEASVCP